MDGADQRVALTLYTIVLKPSGFNSGVMLIGATTITHVQILSQFYHWLAKAVFELNDSRDFGLCEWLTLTTTLPSEELLFSFGLGGGGCFINAHHCANPICNKAPSTFINRYGSVPLYLLIG